MSVGDRTALVVFVCVLLQHNRERDDQRRGGETFLSQAQFLTFCRARASVHFSSVVSFDAVNFFDLFARSFCGRFSRLMCLATFLAHVSFFLPE